VVGAGTGLGPPTIASFTPNNGKAGDSVTITGTNFDTTPGLTRVYFNATLAVVTAISSTSITALVPPSTGSGRIRVATTAGTAVSADDFIIPVGSYLYENIVALARVTPGGSGQALNVYPGGKYGVFLFDGKPGDWRTLDLSAFAPTPTSAQIGWAVYDPRNVKIAEGTATNAYRSVHLPPLRLAGTYALYFLPGSSATVNLTGELKANALLDPAGSGTSHSTSFPGQGVRYIFKAVAGQGFGLGLTAISMSPSSGVQNGIDVQDPNGVQFYSSGCSNVADCDSDIGRVAATGTHGVVIAPSSSVTSSSATVTLSLDQSGVLTPGNSVAVSLTRPGQDGRFTINGTAGQQLGVAVSGVSFSAGSNFDFNVRNADGSLFAYNPNYTGGAIGTLDLPALPETAPYIVFLDPGKAGTGSLTLWLSEDVMNPLVLDGSSSAASTAMLGQTARFTFNATAGQNVNIGMTGLSLTPSASGTSMRLYRPDGTQVSSVGCSTSNPGGGCGLDSTNLPMSGEYHVVVTLPTATTSSSMTLWLSSEVAGTLSIGTPYAVTLARPSQNARLSFSGTAGQQLGLGLSGISVTPAASNNVARIYKPDGVALDTSTFGSSGSVAIDVPVLPVTGTYQLLLDPVHSTTAAMTVSLSEDVSGTLAIDGAAFPVSLTMVGQKTRLTFDGSAGQNLALGLTGLTLAPGSTASTALRIVKPSGSYFATASCLTSSPGGGCKVDMTNLPETATYVVEIAHPTASTSASATATLSSDVTGELVLDTPLNLSLARAGQNGMLTFSGTSGTNRRIQVASLSTSPANQLVDIRVYKPSGGVLTNFTTTTSGGTFNMANLSETGTYKVRFSPRFAATAGMTVTLTSY
jgi:hypothetical protein